ncbi:MAG TPA: M14 family zinc carboxypeptidase [Planctomycetota bacterium]|nr:M14 family zinc carboxypeptidase [Planctomycetota bacterium]
MRFLPLFLLLFPLAVFAQQPSPGGDPLFRVWMHADHGEWLREHLNSLGYDVTCQGHHDDHVEAIVSLAEYQELQTAGLAPLVMENAMPLPLRFALRAVPNGYKNLATIEAELFAAQAAHGSIVQIVNVAQAYGGGATYEGRPIYAAKISDNVTQDEDEPNILMVACHHAREITTPEVILDTLNRLVSGYGTDPVITSIVNNNEIWLAPVWNPDGYNHVFAVNNLWRKNRKPFGTNFGVDQNRNYDLNWGASCGGSNNPASDTYSGPFAESEEETVTMVNFARARRFAKVQDFHSFGREVLQTYGCAPMPALIQNYTDQQAVLLANTIGYGTREPSADGEHYEWEIKENTAYSFLTEIDTEFQPPYTSGLAEVLGIWPQTLAFLQKPIPLTGIVTDANSGLPIEAQLEVVGLNWTQGETRNSRAGTGRYTLFLPDGQHSVMFSKPGYISSVRTVTISGANTTVENVALTPGFLLSASSSGGGTGDYTMSAQNIPSGSILGYTLLSLQTTQPLGVGSNFFDLVADSLTLTIVRLPPVAGSPLVYPMPVPAGFFPLVPYQLGAGSLPFPPGTMLDVQAVAIGAGYPLTGVTPPVRVTF